MADAGNVYRLDPPPQQPLRQVPPTAFITGSQPPRTMRGLVAAASLIAAWPQSGEPAPTQPMPRSQSQVAPLRIVYGQQPPLKALTTPPQTLLVPSWPQPGEPAPVQPMPRSQSAIVPLTLTYGAQPRPSGPLSVLEVALLQLAWPDREDLRLPQLTVRSEVAPLCITYGSQPAIVGPLSPTELSIRGAWPEGEDTRLPRLVPNSTVVPLTLPYGRTPPVQGPLAFEDQLAIAAWPSFNDVPAPVLGAAPSRVAPLTLRYGATVLVVRPPLVVTAEPWGASAAPFTAAWNVPPLPQAKTPYAAAAQLALILREPDWFSLAARVALPVGAPPILARPSALTASLWLVEDAWRGPVIRIPRDSPTVLRRPRDLDASAFLDLWRAPAPLGSAAWNVPPPLVVTFVPYAPLQLAALLAWEPAWSLPPALRSLFAPHGLPRSIRRILYPAAEGRLALVPSVTRVAAIVADDRLQEPTIP